MANYKTFNTWNNTTTTYNRIKRIYTSALQDCRGADCEVWRNPTTGCVIRSYAMPNGGSVDIIRHKDSHAKGVHSMAINTPHKHVHVVLFKDTALIDFSSHAN